MTFPVNPALAAGKATLVDLHKAVKARIAAVVAKFDRFETAPDKATPETPGTPRAPRMIDGWLPPRDPDSKVYPFVLVRPSQGKDSEQAADQDATATLEVLIGTYSDTDDGFLDVVLVIDAIRNDFGSEPAIENTAFEQTGPLTWEVPQEQFRPLWNGIVKTNWTLPRPQRVEARNPQEG